MQLTVSQLNQYVQKTLQCDPMLRDVEVEGEISNPKLYGGNMLFFTLKDANAAIACVAFENTLSKMMVRPFEGMKAIVRGSVSLYARSGQYRLGVTALRASGIGPLYERLQVMRKSLEREGLFSPENKRPVPPIIDTLGVVSSPTGAVIHDIIQVATRRDPQVRILLCPSRVQGIGAAEEIVRAIQILEHMPQVTTIVIARGGGSIEDLWAFNEEIVVRAVAACTKPIVSAVGHETDVTLCDLAADLRVPTPSAAAECAVALKSDILEVLTAGRAHLLDSLMDILRGASDRLLRLSYGLHAVGPARRIDLMAARLQHDAQLLGRLGRDLVLEATQRLAIAAREMELTSPMRALSRGYAIIEKNGKPICDLSDLQAGNAVRLLMQNGSARARIEQVTEGVRDE